ncbi:MBL fold metallo-hydrolase [Chondromyces apiculatus]|uniref:Metallo-beta-lactamase superfamily protein n=1 Tax=Chondromyces apiculatus DSM 436 TaxID=1192034 RepID=A0A017TIZ5_9BACT|nr:MBL fold metallo-hydrolase [Chondromyces apiculatus]EYF08872.1 Metallo-beta-lactamase superfamily protein [Chondromyces apiculatus DSM 436]
MDQQPREREDEEDWGKLFVTRACCGAATCRNFAPELLGEVAPAHWDAMDGDVKKHRLNVLPGTYEEGAFTGVLRQPRSKEDLEAARTAVAACPFHALRLTAPKDRKRMGGMGSPWRAWPRRIDGDVWALGHPSQNNIGATAYFIEHPSGGVLVDLPKPSEEIFRFLAEHGGVRWIFLTHRDHTEHHAEFAARFPGSRRILGAADVNLTGNEYRAATGDVEIKLGDSPDPLTLEGAPIPLQALPDAEFAVIPQPGHTPGSLCLLHRGRFLFTGDHLAYSRRLGHMLAHRLQCWEDWGRQTRSVRRLVALAESGHLRFSWVLPGHGEWQRLQGDGSALATAAQLRRTLFWMERQASGHVDLRRYIFFTQLRMKPRSKLARAVRALGGEGPGSDNWLLSRATRPYLPDHDPSKERTALLRASLMTATALGASIGIAWLATRALSSAFSAASSAALKPST